jgi:hypothetical protein
MWLKPWAVRSAESALALTAFWRRSRLVRYRPTVMPSKNQAPLFAWVRPWK